MKDEELKKEAQAKEAEAKEAQANEAGQEEAAADNGQAACDSTEDAGCQEEGTPEEFSGDAPEGASAKEEKKSFFKKKKDPRDEKIEELTDRVKRQMAEFENFRKRSEKEKSTMYEMGARDIIERMLPVIDNFERGLAAVPEEQREDAFVVGMDKVYRQMLTELDASGVKPIEAVGQEFDPNFHNAVMQVESEEYDSGVVAQELQKGYMYKDSVVRHSMVAVVS